MKKLLKIITFCAASYIFAEAFDILALLLVGTACIVCNTIKPNPQWKH